MDYIIKTNNLTKQFKNKLQVLLIKQRISKSVHSLNHRHFILCVAHTET